MSGRRVLSSQLPKPGALVDLPESEAKHVVRVLRLRDGDRVEVLDGKGHSVQAVLRIRGESVKLEFAEAGQSSDGQHTQIVLELAILKGEAMEWAVEKAVELGIDRLIPLSTAHTVVQIKGKGPEAFRDRWQKIADQALKQCGRLQRLEIDAPISLDQLLSERKASPAAPRLWCDEAKRGTSPYLLNWLNERTAEEASNWRSIHLLVGPEGGWSETERTLLLKDTSVLAISLGSLVLRAETAALFGTSLLVGALSSRARLDSTHKRSEGQ